MPHFAKASALAVAPELSFMLVERLRVPWWSTITEVVDDQVDRHQQLDARRRASFWQRGVAHGGEGHDSGTR